MIEPVRSGRQNLRTLPPQPLARKPDHPPARRSNGGEMMKTVHALLVRLAEVESFALAGSREGGTGATIVLLKT